MTFRCEICYKTFEIGVLIYPLFDCDSPTKLCGRRDFRVSLLQDICISQRQCTRTKTHRPYTYWVQATLSWVKAPIAWS